MEDPELVTLIPDEEKEEEKPPPSHLIRKMAMQFTLVLCLKVATGFAVRSLSKTIKEFDILYPESLSRIDWTKFP